MERGGGRFEALLESAPDGIVLVDAEGRIRLVNRRTEELFGYGRDELLGMRVEQLVPDRFRPNHLSYRAGYAADPRRREMGAKLELYGRRQDGSEFPVEISLSPLDEPGESLVITVIRDVTQRRAAETSFRVLLESAADAILLVESSGRIALVNQRTEELFGYEPGELAGADVDVLVPKRLGKVHVAHRAGYSADPQTREMGARLELAGRRKDGSEFPVEISLSPMRVGDEQRVVTIVRDASDRRAAERERLELAREHAAHAEAQAGRERLASILGEIDAIVWEADPERRRFTFVSRRAEDILGYPLERWLTEEGFWRSIVHPDDVELSDLFFREAAARGEPHEHEYRVVESTGATVFVRDQVRIVETSAGELQLRGVTVDMTVRRELEDRLLQSQKMDAIGQLAGGVAHDFNNLLVVISGHAELLLGRVTDEAHLRQLREISEAARRASGLTAQLLAFGRRAPNITELVDLNRLVGGIRMMLRRLVDEDIALVIEESPGLAAVRADRGQLEQVLVNLVINARDAITQGGEIRIRASSAGAADGLPDGSYVVLEVADNGSGMAPETKARIFEPFFTTKEQGKGTGLGLATVYGIVEQAGGKVTVDSEVGRGTTFRVYLPAAEAEPATAEEPAVSSPTVLVVEDEPAVRRLVCMVLEEEGYRVREASTGREALDLVARHAGAFDLVLTDVVMPDVNGPELVTRLAGLGHAVPVLFMSGYADSKLLSRGVSERTMTILRKPFTSAELKARVAELLDA
jgi:two-component system, cell cycle sensor histidine kinase and response regulator CckA